MRNVLFIIFLIFVLSGCGGGVDSDAGENIQLNNDINQIEVLSDVETHGFTAGRLESQETDEATVGWNNNDGGELRVFVLEIDEESFDVEMPEQTEYTAFDVLKFYSKEHGVVLKVKEYDFGMFVEGIGDKMGDKNNFWLYYVNGKLANASADNTEVEARDIIKFEFTK